MCGMVFTYSPTLFSFINYKIGHVKSPEYGIVTLSSLYMCRLGSGLRLGLGSGLVFSVTAIFGGLEYYMVSFTLLRRLLRHVL